MIDRDILRVTSLYKEKFKNIEPINDKESISHIVYMLYEIDKLIEHRRVEKAFRWLGFIQGWLCAKRYYSVNDLKEHNRGVSIC